MPMVTVYERCCALDCPDPVITSMVGHIISNQFILKNLHGRHLLSQQEPTGLYAVWAYPDEYAPEIDHVIGSVRDALQRLSEKKIEPEKPKAKRKRISRG